MNAPQRTARLHPDTMPVLVVATLLAGGLAAVSFALSFFSLRAVSSWAGIGPELAWAVPVMLDSAILVYTLTILVKRARRERATGAWATLTLWTAVSVGANAAHAAGVPDGWERAVGTVVAGLAPIAVLLATHTIADLIVAPVADTVLAVQEVTVPDTDTVRDAATALSGNQAASAGQTDTDTTPDTTPDVRPDSGQGPVAVASAAVHRHPRARTVARPRPRASDRRADILRLHREGMSVRAIAEELGLGRTSVHDIVRTAQTAAA